MGRKPWVYPWMNEKAAICYNVHMEIRLSGHSAYRTEYHIVWIPKYRRRILNPGLKGYIKKLFPKILRSIPGCEIIEYSIEADHIHMIMIIPPKYSVLRCNRTDKISISQQFEEKVSLALQGLLEGEHSLVTRILCLHNRY